MTSHLLERGNDRRVILQDDELLGGVSPPAILALKVGDQFESTFIEHVWLNRASRMIFMNETINAPMPDVLI